MNGLMTEQEWRKKVYRRNRHRPEWWGAQYLLPRRERTSLKQDRAFLIFLLICSLSISILMPCCVPIKVIDTISSETVDAQPKADTPRRVSEIVYQLPRHLSYTEKTYTKDALYRGKMLLLDQEHPLPSYAPPPNTFSIVSLGCGMIPVRSLTLQSGQSTIEALQELFQALRVQGVSECAVTQATQSRAQIQANRRTTMRELMLVLPPDEARTVIQTTLTFAAQEELLQEYTVMLRFQNGQTLDDHSFESTVNGQKLLRTAWRYGFVRTHPDADPQSGFLFRYVGRAHATAMTYLDLSLLEYLEWLHTKGTLAVYQEGTLKYLIMCKKAGTTHTTFDLPIEADCEISADNLGYAIAACTF